MNIDLSLTLLSVVAILLVALGVHGWIIAKRGAGTSPRHHEFRKVAKGAAITLVVILAVESFIAWPSRIPSGSMMPTIHAGDVVLVEKFAYGLRLPIVHTRILPRGKPQRGDVVVFRFPGYQCVEDGRWVRSGDPTCTRRGVPVRPDHWIKRVVGVPGDRVVMVDRMLAINGMPVQATELGPYRGDPQRPDDRMLLAHAGTVWREQLGQKVHRMVTMADYNRADPLPGDHVPAVLPSDCYLVLGDNRNASMDSRWWGCVPESALVGRVTRMLWGPKRERASGRPFRAIDAPEKSREIAAFSEQVPAAGS